jgi:hypothetical protein
MGPPNAPFGSDDARGDGADGSRDQGLGPWDLPAGGVGGSLGTTSGVGCPRCGYDLTGVTIGARCPECGQAVDWVTFQRVGPTTSGWAVASMVLGIVSILGCMTYGLLSVPCGPLAIAFWWKAKRDFAAGRVGGGGPGMATAGLITGIIGTLLGLTCLSAIAVAVISDL